MINTLLTMSVASRLVPLVGKNSILHVECDTAVDDHETWEIKIKIGYTSTVEYKYQIHISFCEDHAVLVTKSDYDRSEETFKYINPDFEDNLVKAATSYMENYGKRKKRSKSKAR